MVKLKVLISAELDGVTDLVPAEKDHEYFFTVVCTSCREEHPKAVSLNATEEHEISGSRGSAHFVWRCGNCKKEHSASIIPANPKAKNATLDPEPYTSQTSQPSPFLGLDCRGLEFTKFHYRGKWTVKGVDSGAKFEIDFDENVEDGRWDDYDEDAGAPVSAGEFSSSIERM